MINHKITAAKAIRATFNATQRELLSQSYLGDEALIERLREAQEQYAVFKQIVAEIKDEDESLYASEILGVQS